MLLNCIFDHPFSLLFINIPFGFHKTRQKVAYSYVLEAENMVFLPLSFKKDALSLILN